MRNFESAWRTGAAFVLVCHVAAAQTPAPASSAPTAADALSALIKGESMSGSRFAEARSAIEAAATAEPKEDDWQLGLALLARASGDRKKAATHAAEAVALDPKSARNWYWKGSTLFAGIADAGALEKRGIASDGKAAFEKAVELDPAMIEPRVGLAQYYIRAPGIAGGSYRKAREQGKAILATENGAFWGHMVLAMVAQDDEDWKEMAKEYSAAVEGAGSNHQRVQGLLAHASALVTKRRKYEEAMPLLERARALEGTSNASLHFMLGEAKKGLGDCAGAIVEYRRVLELNAGSKGSRYSLAECLEQTGDLAGARAMFEEFAAKFPQDDRADEAASRAKKLGKKLK